MVFSLIGSTPVTTVQFLMTKTMDRKVVFFLVAHKGVDLGILGQLLTITSLAPDLVFSDFPWMPPYHGLSLIFASNR